jgi:hypothetical protein
MLHASNDVDEIASLDSPRLPVSKGAPTENSRTHKEDHLRYAITDGRGGFGLESEV